MSTSVDVAHGPQTTVAWCDEEYFSGRVFWSLAQKLSTTLQLCVTFSILFMVIENVMTNSGMPHSGGLGEFMSVWFIGSLLGFICVNNPV